MEATVSNLKTIAAVAVAGVIATVGAGNKADTQKMANDSLSACRDTIEMTERIENVAKP